MERHTIDICRGVNCTKNDPQGHVGETLRASERLRRVIIRDCDGCLNHCKLGPNIRVNGDESPLLIDPDGNPHPQVLTKANTGNIADRAIDYLLKED